MPVLEDCTAEGGARPEEVLPVVLRNAQMSRRPPLMKRIHKSTITAQCARQNVNWTCLSSTTMSKLSQGYKSLKTTVVITNIF